MVRVKIGAQNLSVEEQLVGRIGEPYVYLLAITGCKL